MLPMMPAFLLLGAIAIQRATRPRRLLWAAGVLAVGLLIAITSRSQLNQREAMDALRSDDGARAVISVGPEIHAYFLARPRLPFLTRSEPIADWFDAAMEDLSAIGSPPNRFLGFAPDRDAIAILLSTHGLVCDQPRRFDGWWLDRWVALANPRHNRRRSPILLWHCERPQMADHFGQSTSGGGREGLANR